MKKSKTSKKRTGPPTPFMERLYVVCKRIPRGKVATYGLLAKVVNSHPRAIGQALRHNPYAPIVPCHRVVAGSLDIGGFGGQWGEQCENAVKKRDMLMGEGVTNHRTGIANSPAAAEDPRKALLVFQT